MSERPLVTVFEQPVRIFAGNGIGTIRTVQEALDWIACHDCDRLKDRLRQAHMALDQARTSGTTADITAAWIVLQRALAREQMLAGKAPVLH